MKTTRRARGLGARHVRGRALRFAALAIVVLWIGPGVGCGNGGTNGGDECVILPDILPAAPGKPTRALQILIEARFLSLSENFLDEVGVDLDGLAPLAPALPLQYAQDIGTFADGFDQAAHPLAVGGADFLWSFISRNQSQASFLPFPYFGSTSPTSGVSPHVACPGPGCVHIDPSFAGQAQGLTQDLDIPFLESSFGIGNGVEAGTELAFATLSDVEVNLLIQAAEAERAGSVLAAPNITFYDGQRAVVLAENDRPVLTEVQTQYANEVLRVSPTFDAQNDVLITGPVLDVVPEVSADGQHVMLDIYPGTSVLDFVPPSLFDVDGVSTKIQLPIVGVTHVTTTVTVPDGGTILLGGLKKLNEVQVQPGVPILDRIPYVNRLFRNGTFHNDQRTLMLLVTPRINILEEAEE